MDAHRHAGNDLYLFMRWAWWKDLRQGNRHTMADAVCRLLVHCQCWKFLQHLIERQEVIPQTANRLSSDKVIDCQCSIQRERSDPLSLQRKQMTPDSQGRADIGAESAYIGAL